MATIVVPYEGPPARDFSHHCNCHLAVECYVLVLKASSPKFPVAKDTGFIVFASCNSQTRQSIVCIILNRF